MTERAEADGGRYRSCSAFVPSRRLHSSLSLSFSFFPSTWRSLFPHRRGSGPIGNKKEKKGRKKSDCPVCWTGSADYAGSAGNTSGVYQPLKRKIPVQPSRAARCLAALSLSLPLPPAVGGNSFVRMHFASVRDVALATSRSREEYSALPSTSAPRANACGMIREQI